MIDLPSTPFLLFTGKGGVGKTSIACAAALALADRGDRVLLVSTDPASNLDEMLGVALSGTPIPVPGAPGLFAMNIDPTGAADAYRERAVATLAGQPESEIERRREELSGACTTEVAVFDAFAALLAPEPGDPAFDRVLFDTAPTGHTLRLLSLPRAWSDFLEGNEHGASCLGPHTALQLREGRFRRAVEALADPKSTAIVLVARPEVSSLREAARTAAELGALGLQPQRLVINAVFEPASAGDPVANALAARGRDAMAAMPATLAAVPRIEIPLRSTDTVGLDRLRALLVTDVPAPAAPLPPAPRLPLSDLVDALEEAGPGLVLVMGKGGVGKTTLAAAIAVALADRGHAVRLSTTDPAAHVAATVESAVPNLAVERIDPVAETAAYIDRAMDRRGRGLDAEGRALLREDLASPCTEEVAVFHAFARIVLRSRHEFVVLDTAPTGHTLLLLDATGAYHRDVVRGAPDASLSTPLTILRDPARTRVILATLAEATPVSEAAALQTDLRRAGVEPWAWIVNASLAAAGATDPVLAGRIRGETAQLERVRGLAARIAVVPWVAEPPVGPAALRSLVGRPP